MAGGSSEGRLKYRENLNRAFSALQRMEERLARIEALLKKLTLDIEEEAREFLGSRLRRMGIEVELGRLELPGLELDIYGVSGDVCVVGEATVRLGAREIERLARRVERLAREHPEKVRPRIVAVAYTSLASEDAVREAERRGIWVLKATKDYTKPPALAGEGGPGSAR